MQTNPPHIIKRSPIVAIMGHIDHGKSTLLSYIRKSAAPLNEAGGITQHISAYEVDHKNESGKFERITFLDTPGHAAFKGHRNRGALVADIAVLVVAAEDGVKPQTIEALQAIKQSGTNFIVAITKIDKPEANIDRTKISLAENEVYVEGYGGDIPVVAVSGKTGEGVSELLDMILLVADLQSLTGDLSKPASGIILESNLDVRKGLSATCIITDGTMKKGGFVVSGTAMTPVRVLENWKGEALQEAQCSMPVRLIGWNALPEVGEPFVTFATKKEAEKYMEEMVNKKSANKHEEREDTRIAKFQLVIKADTGGSLEALILEISKHATDRIMPNIIFSGIGTISENDVRMALGPIPAVVIGFHVKTDSQAKTLAERDEIQIKNFDVIYALSEWLDQTLLENTPSIEVSEQTGEAKVLKVFSKMKDKQVIGCRMETGFMHSNDPVKIIRRDNEIGSGRVRELQLQKQKVSEIEEGKEFGTMIEAKIEIAPGDKLRIFTMVKK